MQNENEVTKEINEIKGDIFTLRTNFNNLIDILKSKIPEVKSFRFVTVAKNTENIQQPETKTDFSVLDYSILKSSEIIELASQFDKNIYECKNQNNFIGFCKYVFNLIEAITNACLIRKFRELQNDRNRDLLEAYLLVKENLDSSKFKNLYINKNEVLKCRSQSNDEDDNFYCDGDKYLSVKELKFAPFIFKFDMCLALLYKEQYYTEKNNHPYKNYIQNTQKKKQSVNLATQRQPTKLKNHTAYLNVEYYCRINNIRILRNIYVHPSPNERDEEIKNLKDYVKVDLDNYDGILEAAKWLLVQLDIATHAENY